MTAVVVVGAIAVVGAVVARVTWRRPGDERHSIENHQQTLDTLRSMADRRTLVQRDGGPAPQPDRGSSPSARLPRARSGPAHAGQSPPGTARAGPGRPGSVRAPASPPTSGSNGHHDLVFVDETTTSSGPRSGELARTPLALPGLPRSTRGGHRRGPGAHGSRTRLIQVVAAAAVLVAVVGLAVALTPSHPRNSAAHHSGTRPKSTTRTTGPRTTVTAPPELQPTTSTPTTAAYAAPSTGYAVELRATGLCWVEATAASTGHVVWTGTLEPGQVRSIPTTGTLIVRLGAANDVSVALNNEPVVFPPGFQSPFNVTFEST